MKNHQKIIQKPLPNHIAIILDGNGRWAKKRGLNRSMGHKAGAYNLKRTTLAANALGIKVMSVYAFSTENWKRSEDEVNYLMALPEVFKDEFWDVFEKNDIRIVFSGRRDRINEENVILIKRVEEDSKHRQGITLNVCLDYGAQDELVSAVKQISKQVLTGLSIDEINEQMVEDHLYTKGLPPVDLMIRTSGEMRLSNFLLWQSAYAELYFTKIHWPAFNERRLMKAIKHYQGRNRRFGGVKG